MVGDTSAGGGGGGYTHKKKKVNLIMYRCLPSKAGCRVTLRVAAIAGGNTW